MLGLSSLSSSSSSLLFHHIGALIRQRTATVTAATTVTTTQLRRYTPKRQGRINKKKRLEDGKSSNLIEYPERPKPLPEKLGIEDAVEQINAQVHFDGDSYYEALMSLNLDYFVNLTAHEDFNAFVEGTFYLPHGSGHNPRVIVMTEHYHLAVKCKELGALHVGNEETLGPKFLANEIQPMWFDRLIATSEKKALFKSNAPLSKLLWKWGMRPKLSDTTLLPPNDAFLDIVKAHIQGQIVPFAIDYENDGFCTVRLGKYGQHTADQIQENLHSVIEHLYTIAHEAEYEPLRDDDDDMLILDIGLGISQIPKNENDTTYKSTDFVPLDVEKIVMNYVTSVTGQPEGESDDLIDWDIDKLKLDALHDESLQSEVLDELSDKPDISGIELRDLRLRSYNSKLTERQIDAVKKRIAWRK